MNMILLAATTLLTPLLISSLKLDSLSLLSLVVNSISLLVLALHNGLSKRHKSIINTSICLSRGFGKRNTELLSELLTLLSGNGLYIRQPSLTKLTLWASRSHLLPTRILFTLESAC